MTIALAVICLALVAALVYVTHQATRERRELCQRIQAPEIAVKQFQDRPEVKRIAPIPVDDDDAFAEHKESLNGDGD